MFFKPILFIVYNRPDTTKQVFEVLKRLKPKYLFVAADGFREEKANDNKKTATDNKKQMITADADDKCN